MDNLKQIIALSINAIFVPLDMKLFNDRTIEDIMKVGIVFLSPTKNEGLYHIVIPLVILHCWNITWNFFPVSFDLPLKKNWNWSSFETWDCAYQLIKNNTCYWLTLLPINFKTDLARLYNSKSGWKENQIQLCEIRSTVQEQKQFLVKSRIAPEETILTNLGSIQCSEFVHYSFRCLTGNPAVDCRTFHLPHWTDHKHKPWMICKQYKHSINSNANISKETIDSAYKDWIDRISVDQIKYRCVFVFITNQKIEASLIEEYAMQKPLLIIICKSNFGEYCPITFSAYSIFDDDKDQEEEELQYMHVENEMMIDFNEDE